MRVRGVGGQHSRAGIVHRQKQSKHGAARFRLTFDDAAMIANDFGNQRQAKPGPLSFGGDERIEQMRLQCIWHTWAIVLDLNH